MLEGRSTVEVDGVRLELGPGDEAVSAPGSLHAWSNPEPRAPRRARGAATRLPRLREGPAHRLGLAADGLVREDGMPRNPLHAALLLDLGEGRLPGACAALERVLRVLARIARRRGIDFALERRYL